jgi:hypothetical protein
MEKFSVIIKRVLRIDSGSIALVYTPRPGKFLNSKRV